MTILWLTHPRFLDHVAAPGHPERPSRLEAVQRGALDAGLVEDLLPVEPRPATRAELARVHPEVYLAALERLSEGGGGHIDPDTSVNEASFEAAVLGAGAGLTAIEALDAGTAEAAFCAVRPPGHHATPTRAMGFCLINHVAIAAAALADRGERVLIVDYDAHHGNGTQDAFYDDDRVAYVSFHEYPLYPGTGGLHETGQGAGVGTTINFPLPAGATGDVYRRGLDDVVAPFVAAFEPTWVLISAGFDAHRADPLTGLGLSAGDYSDLTAQLAAFVPAGRRLVFLEGGYDLDALRVSTAATLSALAGHVSHPEAPTGGGPGNSIVDAVHRLRERTPHHLTET